MSKSKRVALICCAVMNLCLVLFAARVVWGYHQDWDMSGPTQQNLLAMEVIAHLKFRQKHNEPLLDVVHYQVLPAIAGGLLLSASVMVWALRKK
jgi:predicted small integral membrane protein